MQPALLAGQPPSNGSSGPVGHERLFDWINFILLVVVLVYVLRKPLAQFFAGRSSALERDLEGGRKALEAARVQLAEAEEKMRRLGEAIAAYKAAAVREQEAERERLHRAAEEEARRVLASARAMIETATQAARLELRSAAASEAVAMAERIIRERLDDAARARLVSQFLNGIGTNPGSPKN
ncbi:MAG: hypothetical protein ACRD2G_15305 [Terriglobia bacterium]